MKKWMKPMDAIRVKLSPTKNPGMTRLQLSGVISTRLSPQDVKHLWRHIEQLSQQVCVVLPVYVRWPWFEVWAERLTSSKTINVRFVDRKRKKSATNNPSHSDFENPQGGDDYDNNEF